MIAERIKDGFLPRERTPTPASKHVFAHETANHHAGAIPAQNPRKQKMTGVGSDELERLFLAIESHSVEIVLGHPVHLLQALRQFGSVSLQLLRSARVPETSQQRGHAVLGVVHVTLNLDWRYWGRCIRSIPTHRRVPRVLPSLVD